MSMSVYRLFMIEFERDRPIWIQVAETLTERIESGQYPPRHLIPSEVQMVQEFGIARGTARKVVAYLREQGVIYTVPQIGSFVSPAKTPADEKD